MISALLRKRKQPNKIGAFEIDVTISESHGRSAQATGNPIEGGSIINDHVTNDPKTVNMTGVVSNTPLRTLGIGSDEARVQDAFDALEEIFDSREPFDLQTGLKLYRDCVFTSLKMPKTRAGELRFSASFQELTIVRTELATIPSDSLSPNDAAFSSERDAGRQQGIEPNEAQTSSLLVNVTRAVGGLL